MGDVVTYQLKDSIAIITMDDGKVNALSLQTFSELNNAFDRAAADNAVVVLTGRPEIFSAGFDLRVLRAGNDEALTMILTGFKLVERILSFPMPVVIACNGHAIAMGAFLVLSGDYRIGVVGDYKIGPNEVAIGLTMPFSAIEICRQRLTPSCFNRAVINAELFAGEAAVAAGFLDRVVPISELFDVAQSAAAELSKLNLKAHAATKLRAREQTLRAIRAAIEADAADLRAQA